MRERTDVPSRFLYFAIDSTTELREYSNVQLVFKWYRSA